METWGLDLRVCLDLCAAREGRLVCLSVDCPPLRVCACRRYGERSLAGDQRLFVERKVHRERRTTGERRCGGRGREGGRKAACRAGLQGAE